MPGIYDITDKTYIRPNDRIEESVMEELFKKYVGVFSGDKWFVKHDLQSTNLLIGLWKFDATSPAAFYKIEQLDYNSLIVHWTMPVVGKCVLYSIRPFVGVSHIHEQTTPANVWTITHNFGTEDIIFTCWDDNKVHVVPTETRVIDKNTVELVFPSPVTGTAILIITDPSASSGVLIRWDQIGDKPDCYPPCEHKHSASDILGMANIETFGGHAVNDFVLKSDVGKVVPPLEPEGTGNPQRVVPRRYLPSYLPVWYQDSDGVIRALKLIADDKGESPLYFSKDATAEEATLKIKHVVRRLWVTGNITYNTHMPDKCIEASSDYLMRLRIGPGLFASADDRNTLYLDAAAGAAKVFQRLSLADGQEWAISDSIFSKMGSYNLSLFETEVSPTTGTSQSKHVLGKSAVGDAFVVYGDDMTEISDAAGRTTSDKVIHDTDHFVFNDREILKSDGTFLASPSNVDAVYYDPANRWFITRSVSGVTYIYRVVRPSTKETLPYNVCAMSDLPGPSTISGGMMYMLESDGANGFRVLRDAPSNMPSWSWTVHATFPNDELPSVMSTGRIVFKSSMQYTVVLNTEMNTLTVYDNATGTKLHEKSLPQVAKDFDLWEDNYISISFDGVSKLCTSTTPISDPSYSFVASIDLSMGDCSCFAIAQDGIGGALGIKPTPGHCWFAPIVCKDKTPLYAYGETTLWIQPDTAWHVSPLYAKVWDLSWEDYDTSVYDDVRIGFYPGTFYKLPDVLYKWTGSSFGSTFPSNELATQGQTLDEVANLELPGDSDFSYAIYLHKSKEFVLKAGHIVHNLLFTYKDASMMYPVPLGGPTNAGHLLVKCTPGSIVLSNTLGRELTGLKLSVTPAVV